MITTINNKHNKLNVPNLRFPEFQGEWEKHELGDICETITDFVAAGSFASLRENVKYYQEDNYAQLVRTVDLKKDFTNNDFVYVDEFAYDFLWRVQLKEPNIVLPNIGANIGEKYYVSPEDLPKEKNVLGPNAILLRSKCNDTHFVYFRLSTSSYDNEMKKLVGASGQPKFNKTDLKKVRLFMPSLKEQKKISHFLGLLDERIATQNKIIEDLKMLKSAISKLLFTRKDLLETTIRLADIATLKNGYAFQSSKYNILGKWKIITIANVSGGRYINEEDCNCIINLPNDIQDHQVLKEGDILISLTGNVGRVSLCKSGAYLLNQRVGLLQIEENIDKEFLYQVLSSRRFENSMVACGQGAAQMNIGKGDVENFVLPYSSNANNIHLVARILHSYDECIINELRELTLLTMQKQYFLAQMFI